MKLKKGLAMMLTTVIVMCCSSVAAFASGGETSAAPVETVNPLVSIEPRGFNKTFNTKVNGQTYTKVHRSTNWSKDKHIIVALGDKCNYIVDYRIIVEETGRVVDQTLYPDRTDGAGIFAIELTGNEKNFTVYAKLHYSASSEEIQTVILLAE